MHAIPLGGACLASWRLVVKNTGCGTLELWKSAGGLSWRWANKPVNLVSILGVSEVGSAQAEKPFRFFEFDSAVAHLMYCTGVAFGGCGLAAVDADPILDEPVPAQPCAARASLSH